MQMIIDAAGSIACLYDEAIDLAAIGRLRITRASHVEPDAQGLWIADLALVCGPMLGPFELRSEALEAEREWLESKLSQLGVGRARVFGAPIITWGVHGRPLD